MNQDLFSQSNSESLSAQQRIAALRAELGTHNTAYYINDAPTITDTEYDALFRELVELETQHP